MTQSRAFDIVLGSCRVARVRLLHLSGIRRSQALLYLSGTISAVQRLNNLSWGDHGMVNNSLGLAVDYSALQKTLQVARARKPVCTCL